MSAVVARFYIAEIKKSAYGGSSEPQRSVVLQAATRGEENKSWAQATPSGRIEMHINNGDAGQWFEDNLGRDVSLTFAVAEEALPTRY